MGRCLKILDAGRPDDNYAIVSVLIRRYRNERRQVSLPPFHFESWYVPLLYFHSGTQAIFSDQRTLGGR
jgi:hypothetical protein